ncbi:MAG TPA: PEP-CTERM sorting domain-containing protein [Lacipirellulaceae bacterium]|nr:PEP-CTERM sorting domain-containing protein [Lacipirellulaceae bacterium]
MAAVTGAAIVFAVGSAPLFCQAQVIGSFEGSLSSSVGVNWEGPGAAPPDYVTVGATDGSSALAIHQAPNAWTIELDLKGGMALAQAVATHDFLVLDATTTDNGVAGDGWSPSYRQIFVVFNSNQGGWQQNQLDFPVAGDDGGSLTATVVLDLAATGIKANAQAYVNAGTVDGSYWELFLPIQGADQGAPSVKPGDYSNDGVVNTADYVTWRKNLGGSTLANETVSPGTVDAADYAEWRSHFGSDYSQMTTIIDNVRFADAGAGSGSLSAGGVPEPSSLVLTLILGFAVSAFRTSRS